jgi:hypothetical protein
MKRHNGRDGESKTASVPDADQSVEQHEGREQPSLGSTSDHEIAQRAYELWRERGCPQGSAEQDWFEAADQLRALRNSVSTRSTSSASGSVQH